VFFFFFLERSLARCGQTDTLFESFMHLYCNVNLLYEKILLHRAQCPPLLQ